jgi:hypothetical protein
MENPVASFVPPWGADRQDIWLKVPLLMFLQLRELHLVPVAFLTSRYPCRRILVARV